MIRNEYPLRWPNCVNRTAHHCLIKTANSEVPSNITAYLSKEVRLAALPSPIASHNIRATLGSIDMSDAQDDPGFALWYKTGNDIRVVCSDISTCVYGNMKIVADRIRKSRLNPSYQPAILIETQTTSASLRSRLIDTHPDHGGNTDVFMRAMEEYKLYCKVCP